MPDETLTDANDLEAETETGAEAGNEVAVEAEAPKADEGPNCRRLMDFNVANENEQWFVVNDNVMGGRSDGGISFTDDTMVFAGNINTDGGGFSSIRLPLDATALENSARFVMRAKSDGRDYKLTSADALEGRDRRENHQAPLSFVQAGVWEEVVVPFDSLEPVLFGRRIEAAPFRPDLVTRIGVMMSDGIDGAFSLEIDWIDICE